MNITKEQLTHIAMVLSQCGATKEEIVDAMNEARSSQPQRALNKDEYNIFSGSIARAVFIMPSMRDAIALIRPFRDSLAETLYTDRYSRVGIGPMFFLESLNSHRRATLLLHEAMHVLNNHFTRKVDFEIDQNDDNSAKDLEINSLLNRHPKTDLSMLLLPTQEPFSFPEAKSYEQYAQLMKNKGLLSNSQGDTPPESQNQSGGSVEQPEDKTQESQSDSNQQSEKGAESESADNSGQSENSDSGSSEDSQESPEKSESTESQDSSSSDNSSDNEEDSNSSNSSSSSGKQNNESKENKDSSSNGGGSNDSDEESEDEGNSQSGSGDSNESNDESSESIAEQVTKQQSSNPGQSSPKPRPGSSCDPATAEKEKIADDLEIDRASSSEQAVARNNTIARVREEAAKSKERGDRGALMMLQQMELAMQPSKVDWRVIFRNLVNSCRDAISIGRTHHTYRRVNRRLSDGDYIFPGMIRYEPSAIMAIDTSGSMTKNDYTKLLSELESIVKTALRAKDKFKAFCVDAKATEPKPVKSIRDLDLRGGGGTRMEIAVESIELMPKKEIPDIFILATDGGTSWPAFRRELMKSQHKYRTVVLITAGDSFESAKNTLQGLADVIDISED